MVTQPDGRSIRPRSTQTLRGMQFILNEGLGGPELVSMVGHNGDASLRRSGRDVIAYQTITAKQTLGGKVIMLLAAKAPVASPRLAMRLAA